MAGNQVITQTINQVKYQIDNEGYNKVKKQLKNIKESWEKSSSAINKAAMATKTKVRDQVTGIKKVADLERRLARRNQADFNKAAKRSQDSLNKRRQLARDFINRREGAKLTPLKSSQSKIPLNTPENIARVERENAKVRERVAKNAEKNARARRRADNASIAKDAAAERKAALNRVIKGNALIGATQTRLESKYGANFATVLGGRNGAANFSTLANSLKNGSISAGQYRANVAALETQFRALNKTTASTIANQRSLRTTIARLTGAYSAFASVRSIQTSGQFLQGITATLNLTAADADQARDRLAFLRKEVTRLGVDYQVAAKGFTHMSVAARDQLNEDQLKSLFTGFSEYTTALQLSPYEYQRGILSLQQMLSKGVIHGEELRNQLAKAVPGIIPIFEEAIKKAYGKNSINIAELLKTGKVKSKDVLSIIGEKLSVAANKGDALNKALKSNRVALQRLKNAWDFTQEKAFMAGLGDQLSSVYSGLTDLLTWNGGSFAEDLGRSFAKIIEGAWDTFAALHDAFLLGSVYVKHFAKQIGFEGDQINKAWDWALWTTGVLAFTAATSKLLRILLSIVSLKGALSSVFALFGGTAAATTAGGGITAAAGGRLATLAALAGTVSKGGTLVAIESLLGGAALDAGVEKYSPFSSKVNTSGVDALTDIFLPFKAGTYLNRTLNPFGLDRLNTTPDFLSLPPSSFVNANNGKGNINPTNDQQRLDILLKINDENLLKIIDEAIVENNSRNVNLLIGQ